MNKATLIFLFCFYPVIASCTDNVHIVSGDSKLENKNEYNPVFLYSDNKKLHDGYVSLSLLPDSDGLGGVIVFNSMAYEDKKKLFELYQTSDDRLIKAPRKTASISLNGKHFVDISVSSNTKLVSLDFPYIASDIKIEESIASQQNAMRIKLDPNIKYNTEKDARNNRMDWLNTNVLIKNNKQNYEDQAQLKLKNYDINTLSIKAGCLSSESKGKIKSAKVFMTEVDDNAKIKDFKVIELKYIDPVFQTSFLSQVNVKLQKNSLTLSYRKHVFKLVCSTTKGMKLSAHDTYVSKVKPRYHEY